MPKGTGTVRVPVLVRVEDVHMWLTSFMAFALIQRAHHASIRNESSMRHQAFFAAANDHSQASGARSYAKRHFP